MMPNVTTKKPLLLGKRIIQIYYLPSEKEEKNCKQSKAECQTQHSKLEL